MEGIQHRWDCAAPKVNTIVAHKPDGTLTVSRCMNCGRAARVWTPVVKKAARSRE
jgi:hypothetical protein